MTSITSTIAQTRDEPSHSPPVERQPLQSWDYFNETVVVDFEFQSRPGHRPNPHCLVAHWVGSNRRVKLFLGEKPVPCPYPTDERTLFVAFNATSEVLCHLALGWPIPERILDLFVEFRARTNGLVLDHGRGLLGACAHMGLSTIGAAEKTSMRELALRGGPFSVDEQQELLEYCQSDVVATTELLAAMRDDIDLPRAILRGRYTTAAAKIEHEGIPLDGQMLRLFQQRWDDIQTSLVRAIDRDFGVYEGTRFKSDRFAAFLIHHDIPWPFTEEGKLRLDDDTFRTRAISYPALAPLRELRATLSRLRLNSIAIGPDERNRTPLWAFSSKTSRNQPSSSSSIFGPSRWIRSLIRPEPGSALSYLDWSSQEFALGACLSGDTAMMEAYEQGDPYISFAIRAGAAPEGATKETHPDVRALYKTAALAVGYGMGAEALAQQADIAPYEARNLRSQHKEAFPSYWTWTESQIHRAMLTGKLETMFGWPLQLSSRQPSNPRSLANFAVQANAAEMMRLAAIFGTEEGIRICGVVHDAFLIEAPIEEIESAVGRMTAAMDQACHLMLGHFTIRVETYTVRHPERFVDERGERMWRTVQEILQSLGPVAPMPSLGSEGRQG